MSYRTDETIILILQATQEEAVTALSEVVHNTDGFVVVPGTKNYIALIYDPPAFPEEETQVMKALTRILPGEHFSIWTYPGEENVHTYINGKKANSRHLDLKTFTSSLGFNFFDHDVTLEKVVWSALIIPEEAGSLKEIESFLVNSIGKDITDQLLFRKHEKGTVIYHPTADISIVLFALIDEYELAITSVYWKSNQEFMVQFDIPEEDSRTFFHPLVSAEELEEDPELLADVDGVTLPAVIVKNLGLDKDLLPKALL